MILGNGNVREILEIPANSFNYIVNPEKGK